MKLTIRNDFVKNSLKTITFYAVILLFAFNVDRGKDYGPHAFGFGAVLIIGLFPMSFILASVNAYKVFIQKNKSIMPSLILHTFVFLFLVILFFFI